MFEWMLQWYAQHHNCIVLILRSKLRFIQLTMYPGIAKKNLWLKFVCKCLELTLRNQIVRLYSILCFLNENSCHLSHFYSYVCHEIGILDVIFICAIALRKTKQKLKFKSVLNNLIYLPSRYIWPVIFWFWWTVLTLMYPYLIYLHNFYENLHVINQINRKLYCPTSSLW